MEVEAPQYMMGENIRKGGVMERRNLKFCVETQNLWLSSEDSESLSLGKKKLKEKFSTAYHWRQSKVII